MSGIKPPPPPPPSSNSHQTSMVPLPCFFLNCWLDSNSRFSVWLRGPLVSAADVTHTGSRFNKKQNKTPMCLEGALVFPTVTSNDEGAALDAGGFWRTGVRVWVFGFTDWYHHLVIVAGWWLLIGQQQLIWWYKRERVCVNMLRYLLDIQVQLCNAPCPWMWEMSSPSGRRRRTTPKCRSKASLRQKTSKL